MKNTFYFMLGIVLVILTSATTVSVMTVKPAKPKLTLVKSFLSEIGSEQVAEYIKNQVKNGYILKSVEGANNGKYQSTWIIVMERY